jgi:hypothetical protein
MGTKKILAFALVALFVISVVSFQPATVKAQTRTLIVPDQYPTIQDAINNASVGDVVFVRSGTYDQNISISKSITLIGQNSQNTKLTMPQFYTAPVLFTPPSYAININANDVDISNFTVENSNIGGVGINSNGNGNQISGMNLDSEQIGISLSGSNQYISENLIANTLTGIQSSGSYNQIIGNTISSFSGQISLSGSYNLFAGNQILDNGWTEVVLVEDYSVLYNNIFNKGDIHLENSNWNIIYNNTLSGGFLGVGQVGVASSNVIARNIIEGTSADGGIIMFSGSNNEFYGNLVANNKVGLALGVTGIGANENYENNNAFFYNMFINNSGGNAVNRQLIDSNSNSFDNGTVGNYWDDYLTKYPNATEVDNSGVGNTPYLVYGNVTDNYPLMAPFDLSTISIQLPTWIKSLPNLQPIPTFPPQTLTISSPTPTSTPSVPELSWLVIVPLLLSVFAVAAIFRHRKKPLTLS